MDQASAPTNAEGFVPFNRLRDMLVRRIEEVFKDPATGGPPVRRSGKALFPPTSVIWRVHGDVTTMMIGGMSALLLQMLHPAALAGIWDHSTFRNDMLGRLRRTAQFVAMTTYGHASEAAAAIARVRAIHEQVQGVLPSGVPYRANDARLLAWVHTCETHSFLRAWIAYGEPEMSQADQDTYFRQVGKVAHQLGAAPIPQSRYEAWKLLQSFRPELTYDGRTRAVSRTVLAQPAPSRLLVPIQLSLTQAAVDILPEWAKQLHGLNGSGIEAPLLRASALATATAVRWAFRR